MAFHDDGLNGASSRPGPWAIRDLGELSVEELRDWLLSGVTTWTGTGPGSPERIGAFSPIALNHRDEDGPGQLAAMIKRIHLPPTAAGRLNQAVANAIETWLPSDNIPNIVFLLRLAGHISWQASFEPHVRVLLSRAMYPSDKERGDFSRAISFAATQRLSTAEVRRTAHRLRTLKLATPDSLVEFVARLAVPDPDPNTLIEDTTAFLLDVWPPSLGDPLLALFTDLLVDGLGMENTLQVAYSGTTRTHILLQNMILLHRVRVVPDQTVVGRMVFSDRYTSEIIPIPHHLMLCFVLVDTWNESSLHHRFMNAPKVDHLL